MELKANFEIEFKTIKRGWSEQHLYIVGGVEYPSVTAILGFIDDGKSGALMGWAKKVAVENMRNVLTNKINQQVVIDENLINWLAEEAKKEPERLKEEACDIGSQCHNAIDEMINGISDYRKNLLEEKAIMAFENFLKWFNQQKLKFIKGDTPVVSLKHSYGGRLDALALDEKGNLILLDWKTSNSLKNTYALQVGAYNLALKETYNVKAKKAFVVRFSKETEEVEEKEVDLKKAERVFVDLIKFFKSFKQNNIWKKEVV